MKLSVSRRHPARSEGPPLWLVRSLLLLVLLHPIPAHPQGCSECRESVGQTSARTQTAYRRAILLMITASGTIFLSAVLLLRRHR